MVGLGYVGLPLAVVLSEKFETWGLDIDQSRIDELKVGYDRTREIDCDRLKRSSLNLIASVEDCAAFDVIIVTVPTPVDSENVPDLGPVMAATRMVAKLIDRARRPVIVYESTVYPGVTEDICGVEIERLSGLKSGVDFFLGYSPERINPGDKEHTIDRIVKVVAGQTTEVTDRLARIYGSITTGGTFKAASIKVAEAAKVIENTQRDVNIALMNEVSQIFSKMDISVWDVLEAARTKWNFLPFQPGLVGGHCIGVDPYYLSFRAKQLGHNPAIILAGRATNDDMPDIIADSIHERCGRRAGSVLVLGLTFKEDVPDLRNSKVANLIARLDSLGHQIVVHDPLAHAGDAFREYRLKIETDPWDREYELVVLAVPHQAYIDMGVDPIYACVSPGGMLADIKGIFAKAKCPIDRHYWTL